MAAEQSLNPKTPLADDPVLAGVVRRLVDMYRPERIYLFGSVARGDANPDSDYDLMVVVPDAALGRFRSEDPGYGVLRGTGIGADILIWTRKDFDRQLHSKASLPSTVVREGRALYLAA
jgi:predicted nucleotidyltransferase